MGYGRFGGFPLRLLADFRGEVDVAEGRVGEVVRSVRSTLVRDL